tara:strand:+ start:21 stop:266 length:246 start_codon:yes stop_codon:yes gene_type:complete
MFKSFQRLLNSEAGKYIISILLGIGLATLFRKACDNRNCLVFKAPSPDVIKDKIYKYDNNCYTFQENNIQCGTNKQQVEFQ